MIQKLSLFLFLFLLETSSVLAHIINKENLYEDSKYSEAADEIVFLSGMGVIPYQNGEIVYRPQDSLTRAELARWSGTFWQLMDGDSESEAIEKAALAAGLVSSLIGNATYEDINQSYFKGKATVSHPNDEVTREAFAMFVAENVAVDIDGQTLYDIAGFSPGPTGVIEKVTVATEKNDNGVRTNIYTLQVAGEDYVLSEHPRIIQATVDPLVWEGQTIKESWLSESHDSDEHSHNHSSQGSLSIQQLVFAEAKTTKTVGSTVEVVEEKSGVSPYIFVSLAVIMVAWAFVIIRKKKRCNK